jgi:hypothetical protein
MKEELDIYLDEEDERIGRETDEWMDVNEMAEFISMKESPGDILVRFKSKPTMQRSKYGGKKQFWFPVEQYIPNGDGGGMWKDMILSTGSTKLRREIKRIFSQDGGLFDGQVAVGIHWSGMHMDRTYSASIVVMPNE